MRVRLYVEGGGVDKTLRSSCRVGFAELLSKAGFRFRIVACGSRNDAFDRFKTAVNSGDDQYPMLLVDSEAKVRNTDKPWSHLARQDGWKKPRRAKDNQAQLMVQCMETWCVADREAMHGFFGHDLQESALPPLNDLEERSKNDVQRKLKHATRQCGDERMYRKGKRSFQLIAKLDPNVLKEHLPHFKRLCETLTALM